MRPTSDLTQVAIDTLASRGTDRGLALAAEIERGRSRQPYRMPSKAEREAQHRESERDQAFMLEQLRVAQPWEWSQWVATYLRTPGGKNLTRHDRPMNKFYVAHCDLTVRPLYGALSLNIIVPAGIKDDGGATGHTNLFGYDVGGITYRGFHNGTTPQYVPVFSDTELTVP